MRAISPHAEYKIQVRQPKLRRGVTVDGSLIEVEESKSVLVEFEHFAITPEEEVVALKTFNFSGVPQGINPLTTLGVWDSLIYQRSTSISDKEREEIEDLLRQKGEAAGWRMFIVVDEPRAAKPWKTYDEDDTETIVAAALRFGFVDEAITYEKENLNRQSLLEELGVEAPEAPIEVSV